MKKPDQIELPFDGVLAKSVANTLGGSPQAKSSRASVVCFSEKRLEKHVGVVYGRLLESGFALSKVKR